MFYVAQEFEAITRYIIYCQSAPTSEEVATGGYYPAPLHTLYHKRRTYELLFIRLTHIPTAHKWAWLYRFTVRNKLQRVGGTGIGDGSRPVPFCIY